MANSTVLVVDDDFSLREFLKISLQAHGYKTLEAPTGRQALELAATSLPDAILLDLGLPDGSGLEVTRSLREWTSIPILVVSVRDDEETIVQSLDDGADDYLSKPFKMNELLARLRAALRRKGTVLQEATLVCGAIVLDPDRRFVEVTGQRVALTPNEFSLLQVLMQNQGRVVTHKQLLRAVWGEKFLSETQLLRVHVSNLRKKLEVFEGLPRYLSNEPSIGYRLSAP